MLADKQASVGRDPATDTTCATAATAAYATTTTAAAAVPSSAWRRPRR